MFKSPKAVLAGVVVIVLLSIVTDAILRALGVQLQNLLIVALAYRTVYAFVGGYVTARLAPNNPQRHVQALLIIGTIMGTLGALAAWSLSDHWYPISLVITSAVAVWFGGKVALRK